MCGRYSLFAPPGDVEARFDAAFDFAFEPTYNAAPGQTLPVVTDEAPDAIRRAEWGFVPTWAEDRSAFGYINARAETVARKRTFADAFEGGFGLSRGVITASYNVDGNVESYVDEERQIGETGQVVEPDVYIASGISGAVQHKSGMDESEFICSINTDPEAPIKDFSDVYINGDLFEVIPRLVEALQQIREGDE